MRYISKHVLVVLFCCLTTICTWGQIKIQADFTDQTNAKGVMPYHLNVYNRITPINGFNAPHSKVNTQLCIVRPLGGISHKGQADLAKDSYKWNAEEGKFYTDFSLLKKQIDGVFHEGIGIYHLVLDNPSWAFQRAADGTLLGDTLKVSTYGNAEPPRDFEAWGSYLKEVMSFLITTYGKEEMLKIHFGVGREIGTPTHWSGTKEQFFEFYRISVEAILAVLPEAKVGTHLLWGSSKKAWGTDFVKWAKANNVPYHFVGVSFYPFYDKPGRTNFTEVYAKDFGVIKDLPEWNEKAQLEMHEYALIETLSKAGNAFKSADQAHQNAFMVGMMKMFFEHGMHHIFQWGDGRKYQPASSELRKMEGDTYYKSTKSGTQYSDTNYVDAIFAKGENLYSIMAYNYSANPSSNVDEDITLIATIDVPAGSRVKYRSAVYDKAKHSFLWSEWLETRTQGPSTYKSSVSLSALLPVFSFLKYEIQMGGEDN